MPPSDDRPNTSRSARLFDMVAAEVAAAEARGWNRAIEVAAQFFEGRAEKVKADAEAAHMTDTQGVHREMECARLIRGLANG